MKGSEEEMKERSLFVRNTTSVASVEFIAGVGHALLTEATFLQVYMHEIGASNFLISFIPTLLFLDQSAFGLLSGCLSEFFRYNLNSR